MREIDTSSEMVRETSATAAGGAMVGTDGGPTGGMDNGTMGGTDSREGGVMTSTLPAGAIEVGDEEGRKSSLSKAAAVFPPPGGFKAERGGAAATSGWPTMS